MAIRTVLLCANGTETNFLSEDTLVKESFISLLCSLRDCAKGNAYIEWENGSAVVIDVEIGKDPEIEIYDGDIVTRVTNFGTVELVLNELGLDPKIEAIERIFEQTE